MDDERSNTMLHNASKTFKKYIRFVVIMIFLGGCMKFYIYNQKFVMCSQFSIGMRHLSLSLNEYYEVYNKYPPAAPIYDHRGGREDDAKGMWYEYLMMIDPDSIRYEVKAYGFSRYYAFYGALSDPPSRQWSMIYNSTTDSCILIMPGWDGEMEIDMINIDLTDVQTYKGRDWREFQYDPSNGLKSRGDYIVVCHKGKTIYHP